MNVAIIDYQLSNLFSVLNACEYVNLKAIITSDPKEIEAAELLILPGVGAFGDAMKNLDRLGLTQVIKDSVANNKPLVGVCLGLQLVFDESEEFGKYGGLGLIPGRVIKFPRMSGDGPVRVPQIGWNSIYHHRSDSWENTPLEQMVNHTYMYFVHSYLVKPNDSRVVLSYTNYAGIEYCSSIIYKNILAFQFHPEKSGHEGVKIYRGLKKWVKNL